MNTAIVEQVRIATPQDAPAVLQLCRQLEQENAVFPMNDDKVICKLNQAFNRQLAICGVIGPPDQLRGSIFLEIGTSWYSDRFGLFELWNFVHPDHRRSNYAKILIDFAKGCSVRLNLPLQIGIFSTKRTEAKIRLYERRLGTTLAGAFFIFNGQCGIT